MIRTVKNSKHLLIVARQHDGIRPGEKGISPGPHALGLLCALLTTGCIQVERRAQPDPRWDRAEVTAPLTRAQLNTPAALRRDYMRHDGEAEQLDPAVDPTLVMDEALLVSVAPEQTCLLVTLRTEATYDAPIADARPRCLVDGREEAAMIVGQEQAAPLEHWWETRDLAGHIFNEKVDHMVQIISRVATVCCPSAPYRALELHMTHPELGMPPRETYRLKLGWALEPAP